jgi:hypothetical protein
MDHGAAPGFPPPLARPFFGRSDPCAPSTMPKKLLDPNGQRIVVDHGNWADLAQGTDDMYCNLAIRSPYF